MSGYVFNEIAQTKDKKKNTRVTSRSASGWGLEESLLRPTYFFFFLREKWEWGEEPEKSNQVTKDIENEFFKKKLMGMQLFHL